jgi:hypothetical protein
MCLVVCFAQQPGLRILIYITRNRIQLFLFWIQIRFIMPKFSEQFQLLFDICFTLNYFELLTGSVLLQKNQNM